MDNKENQMTEGDLQNNPVILSIQSALEQEKQEYANYEAQVESRDRAAIEELKRGVTQK